MTEPLHHDSISTNGVTLSYSYCHSRRKTISVAVKADQTITVRAPMRTSLARIREFIVIKAGWIMKIRHKLDTQKPYQQQEYAPGSIFLFQGDEYRLKVEAGDRNWVTISDGYLLVTTCGDFSGESLRERIDAWYRTQAARIIEERAVACHQLMRQEQIPLPPIVIRSMRSRWGSYSYRTARICINLNLIKAPQRCLDYVLIHELCHIRVRHHGPEFWDLVGSYMPDYPALRRQLKTFG